MTEKRAFPENNRNGEGYDTQLSTVFHYFVTMGVLVAGGDGAIILLGTTEGRKVVITCKCCRSFADIIVVSSVGGLFSSAIKNSRNLMYKSTISTLERPISRDNFKNQS